MDKHDTDNDGKIDQIVHYSRRGQVSKIEVDTNADEVMDRFQYYERDRVIRIERDTDYDRKIDCWDFFEDEKRVRQERDTAGTGKVDAVIYFDDQERPLRMKRDYERMDFSKPFPNSRKACSFSTPRIPTKTVL